MNYKSDVENVVSNAVETVGGVVLMYAGTVVSDLVPVPVRVGMELLGGAMTVKGGCGLVNVVSDKFRKKPVAVKND